MGWLSGGSSTTWIKGEEMKTKPKENQERTLEDTLGPNDYTDMYKTRRCNT